MPACTAFGWKSRTRVASSEAPGSAPPPPQAVSERAARTAASDATTFIRRRAYPRGNGGRVVAMADHGLQDDLLAFIEIPKGSRNKYEFDEGIEQVILDRFLSSSTVYPTDYGYLI